MTGDEIIRMARETGRLFEGAAPEKGDSFDFKDDGEGDF
jgi:hypothetical protein